MESEADNLLEKLKNGNKDAFTRIFYIYNSRLSYFAKAYVIDEDIAANLVQDAFIQLWENKKKLNDNTSVAAYLYTITRNNCLNYLKHQRVEAKYHQKVIKDGLELELNYGALRSLDYDLYDFEEVEKIIDKTIEMLSPQCRQANTPWRASKKAHSTTGGYIIHNTLIALSAVLGLQDQRLS